MAVEEEVDLVTIKEYPKEDRALRTETSNNVGTELLARWVRQAVSA